MNNNYSKNLCNSSTLYYINEARGKIIKIIILSLICGISIIVAISVGAMNIPFYRVISTIFSFFTFQDFNLDESTYNIIINIRLPRVLMGMMVGMSLGVCGAVMQMILHNPMASPFTLGVSSGASLGAAIAIIYPISILDIDKKYCIVTSAFLFSMLVCILILILTKRHSTSSRNLILAGIAIMYFFKAFTTLLTYFSDVYTSREIVMWQVGSLWKSDWESLRITTLVFIIVFPYFLYKSIDLNKMILGDEVATSLGVNVSFNRRSLMVAVAILTATATSFTGTIGFVGLVTPHLIGGFLGYDNRFLIPASAIGGGTLLVIADCISLNIIAPLVLPVGVLTSFIGSPLFLFMIIKSRY